MLETTSLSVKVNTKKTTPLPSSLPIGMVFRGVVDRCQIPNSAPRVYSGCFIVAGDETLKGIVGVRLDLFIPIEYVVYVEITEVFSTLSMELE